MYFVPEGQHDSSQARRAWSHEENCTVPAGRLNGSRLRGRSRLIFGLDPPDFDRPSGTGLSASHYPGTSCLATVTLSLWDKRTKAIRPSKGLALIVLVLVLVLGK